MYIDAGTHRRAGIGSHHTNRPRPEAVKGGPSMSDIFISYKREEQPIARKLADALDREGWSVWWDPNPNSRCKPDMIRDEATYALEKGKLVPVAIETVDLPLG